MASLVPIFGQTVTLQGYQLVAPGDMLSALQYISGLTGAVYSGTINCNNVGGTVTWKLLVNNTTANTSQFANMNDWLILQNNSTVTVCPAANFTTLYHT